MYLWDPKELWLHNCAHLSINTRGEAHLTYYWAVSRGKSLLAYQLLSHDGLLKWKKALFCVQFQPESCKCVWNLCGQMYSSQDLKRETSFQIETVATADRNTATVKNSLRKDEKGLEQPLHPQKNIYLPICDIRGNAWITLTHFIKHVGVAYKPNHPATLARVTLESLQLARLWHLDLSAWSPASYSKQDERQLVLETSRNPAGELKSLHRGQPCDL